MRLFNFLLARNHQVTLLGIEPPNSDFASLLDVFEKSLAQEHGVSRQIDALYELAFREKVFAAMAELQWFITEQVEEEKTVREIVAKLKMVSNDPASILDLDRELGARKPEAGPSGGLKPADYDNPTLASSVVAKRSNTPSRPAMASSSVMRVGVPTRRSRPPLRLTVTCAAMSSPSRVLSM